MDKPSSREDRFESLIKRILRVLDRNRNIVAVSAVALILIVAAVVFRVYRTRQIEASAWADLARAGGHLEPPSRLRELVKRYDGTSAEFYMRLALARKLFTESRKLEDKSEDRDVQKRVRLLAEAVDVVDVCRKEDPDHPLVGEAQAMYERLQKELTWANKHGGAQSPETKRLRQRRTWSADETHSSRRVEQMDDKPGELPQVTLETDHGAIVIELFEDDAPNHVANFIALVQEGALDGRAFYLAGEDRVECGCPDDTGGAKSDFVLDPEITLHEIRQGILGMVREKEEGFESTGRRFFIARREIKDWKGKVTIFGRLLVGLVPLGKLKKGDRIKAAWLDKKRMHPYEPWVTFVEPPGEKKGEEEKGD
jgi:peptidyl-prolyl cis-trans isomerase B (cyclophilin B)